MCCWQSIGNVGWAIVKRLQLLQIIFRIWFSAPIDFKLGLIDFKLQISILVQSIRNSCAAFAIVANNFQKIPKLSDFPMVNCKRANWDLVWMQEKSPELVINDLPWADALLQNVQLYTMGSQKLTMPLQLLQNATQQSDHHTQQCQLQKLSQSHQAIAHQHMSTKCQKQQPDVDRDLAAQSDQIQDATKGCVPQIRQQWHGQTITEQIRLSQLQKHQTIHQNPSQVQKIQWESHQSLSENRCYQSESNENPTKAYQKTEVLNQNPMTIHQKLHQD